MKQNRQDLIHPEYDSIANKIMLSRLITTFSNPLYHWTSAKNGQKILKSKKIKMTNAFHFSDNGEFIHGMNIIIHLITVKRTEHVMFENLREIRKELTSIITTKDELIPYVACFTKNKFNQYLKNNYGQNGNGYLFEIKSKRYSQKREIIILNVMYDYLSFIEKSSELLTSYSEHIEHYQQSNNREAVRHIVPLFIRDLVLLAISYKNRKYSAEEEIRFVNTALKGTYGYINTKSIFLHKKYYHLKKI